MVNVPTNATGWNQLMNGSMINAVYTMFDTAFGGMGIVVVILFVVYQMMLYQKTRNLTLMWIIGIFFASLYATSQFVEPLSVQIIFLLLVFELGGMLYMWLFAWLKMARKRCIITTNKEIYCKLNMLLFSDDVVVKEATESQINKILNNVNKYSEVLACERIGDYFLLQRQGPLNFDVYFRQKWILENNIFS